MIVLAIDVDADADRVSEILTTTEGMAAVWTSDGRVGEGSARFGFPEAPVDLECSVEAEPGKRVRFTVDSGFPYWNGSVFEFELGPAAQAEGGTNVLFRHRDFEDGFPEQDRGMVAQVWASILQALKAYAETGTPQPALG